MQKHQKHNKTNRFADIEDLEERIKKQSPQPGEYFYDYKLEEAEKETNLIEEQNFHHKYKINFSDLPISQETAKGLSNRKFKKMTEVQRCSIPHALANRDLLVSSRTGSGKTLAYLVPLVEKLYRQKFIPMDGLGALVIVPVRQLAMQVFQVLNSFTQKTQISVGLVIGGKNVKYEQDRIKLMNILVCTPGRLLQHLQETYGFQTSNLQMLVLDQADVMLEMGFKEHLQAIFKCIPRTQTLLFSATMTKNIMALAQISTSQPQKILLQGVSAHKEGNTGTGTYEAPSKLTQYYMVVKPQDKINTFYSFLKSHQKQKMVIFFSTCKQVRFLYEAFRKFKLGTPLYQLQGHQKQTKRMAIYFTFCQKKHGILLCTNIAARGLDFPRVDWVLQFDAPDQCDLYVHRVGRTARYRAQGKSLLFLSQTQAPFVDELKAKNIQIHRITQNPQRYLRVDSSIQSICSQHQDVKYLAQRALISYLRFLSKAHNKKLFDIRKIDLEALSHSYGLPSAPIINFKGQEEESQNEDDEPKMTKIQKMRQKQKLKKAAIKEAKLTKNEEEQQIPLKQKREKFQNNHQEQQGIDDLLTIKKVVKHQGQKAPLTSSKRQLKKIKSQGPFEGKNKVFFDESLNPISADEHRRKLRMEANKETLDYDVNQLNRNRLQKHGEVDDERERVRRREKRKKKDVNREIQKKGGQRVAVIDSEDQQQFQE